MVEVVETAGVKKGLMTTATFGVRCGSLVSEQLAVQVAV